MVMKNLNTLKALRLSEAHHLFCMIVLWESLIQTQACDGFFTEGAEGEEREKGHSWAPTAA